MASSPHAEPPIYVEDFHSGGHHQYDLSDTSAVERYPTAGRETWINIAAIPAAPPAPAPFPGGPVVGDARGVQGVPLTQVPGNPYRYAYQGPPPQQFAEMVPANYGGGAYKPTLRDSGGQIVPYNPSVWVADGLLSVVEFRYRTPQELGYAPPFTLDYWRYVGPVVSTSGALANDGTGAQVYEVGSSNPSLLRTLVADPGAGLGGIVITQNPTEIAVGNSLTGNNLNPAGVNVGRSFAQKTAALLDFRTLKAGTDITITETATEIIISALPDVGLSGLNNGGTGFDVYDVPVGTTALLRRLNPGAGGISIAYAGVSGVNAYLDIDNTLTGANVGGGAGVFSAKAGANLNFRSLVAAAGSGLALTQNANEITIGAAGTIITALANEGVGTGLIFDAVVGNTANLRSLLADTAVGNAGITISTVGTEVVIGNTLTGASLGGTAAVFANKTGATLNFRGITAGTGITVTQNANDISINNTDRGSAVTLASAGGTETLVNDGVGPALATKGLSAGTGGISLTGATGSVTINNTLTGASLGGAPVFANKTGATLNLRGITAGTGITVTQNANDITLTNADRGSAVTLASAGGTETLVNDGVGPALATKGLSAGTGGISLTGATGSVTIDNTLTGASLGGAAVFAGKTGSTLNLRGIAAGAGIAVTQNANDIVITNTSPMTVRPYAGIYFRGNGNTMTTGTGGVVFVPIALTVVSYEAVEISGFTHAGGVLTYSGAVARRFLVSYHMSGINRISGPATRLYFNISKAPLTTSYNNAEGYVDWEDKNNTPAAAFGSSHIILVAPGGGIELRVGTFSQMSFFINQLHLNVVAVD